MPLYLASSGLVEDDLVRAPTRGARAVVVLNALDPYPGRADGLAQEVAGLAARGWDARELDLRDCIGRPADLAQELDDAGLMWVVGGNTFVLARAMALAGLRPLLLARLADPAFIYAGYSAGAVVAGPDLDGIELVDDPAADADRVPSSVHAETLGLIDFRVVPHWRSDNPDSAAIEHVADHMSTRGLAHRCLHDGEALWIDGGVVTMVGAAQ